jgi:hypothetical protein
MVSEISIVNEVQDYLDNRSFNTFKEFPFLQRHVDIIGFDPQNDVLIAIEAKVKNWQVAIQQAITCLLFADEVYIAMPHEYVHRVNRSELAKYGIGLLEVDSEVRINTRASASRYSSTYDRSTVIERLYFLKPDFQRGERYA